MINTLNTINEFLVKELDRVKDEYNESPDFRRDLPDVIDEIKLLLKIIQAEIDDQKYLGKMRNIGIGSIEGLSPGYDRNKPKGWP